MSNVSTVGITRIPVRYSRTLLIRGIAIWVLARLSVQVVYLVIASSTDRETAAAFTNGSPMVLAGWILALAAVLVRLDLYRRHEIVLLNNLGVLNSHVILLGTLPAVGLEIAMAILR